MEAVVGGEGKDLAAIMSFPTPKGGVRCNAPRVDCLRREMREQGTTGGCFLKGVCICRGLCRQFRNSLARSTMGEEGEAVSGVNGRLTRKR